MKAVNFPQANLILNPPSGQEKNINPLYTHHFNGGFVSCWEITEEELEKIKAGERRVWLWVLGQSHPPVLVTSADPFAAKPPAPQGPDVVNPPPKKRGKKANAKG